MADRIFAGVLFFVALGYTYIAFFILQAPFQYDPLGPESWPQILGIVALLCLAYILIRPDTEGFDLDLPTGGRLVALFVFLMGYAYLFQPFGFIISTFLFCAALSLMLGAKPLAAVVFSAATGVFGYFICTILLDINLPAGPIVAAFL
ncbi:tripartite tricarboxylate transporter TctB family protein [Fulvimarina sp. 2208YS6-2-32]|uniref:Tripartite tricarboxylate transporter TctB family protein n=1 Tax=Fulvimarina uroteuthidis TaxID=3098149 RepID=A0ABU5I5D7_9HYPH|nr:tripartite tricarboxylate transporter TctB family protein [Fulvimarina sp. 2208YS6-2-32]MDY8110307.1 tripartite tricarboxylate transporter TctB family protein [Fulvimarina sp. 2208YS6-2-32]